MGLRLVPMERDLRFAWEGTRQQVLDVQAQKVRESLHAALIEWAKHAGEGSDYTDNVPQQCLHPVGHWYEVPNLLRNGVLARMLRERPQLHTLLLHNVDTVGADPDPALLALHREQVARGATLTFEVIPRQLDDRGGGLARVDGRPRLVEGLALPREELELELSYYNTMTTWIDVDGLLRAFELTREDLLASLPPEETASPGASGSGGASDSGGGSAARGRARESRSRRDAEEKIAAAVRKLAARLPTYVTLKDVKKRWGHGQEDVFPVAQFEKLWSDMSALPELTSRFLVVRRERGQQLKDPAQLDGWLRDGSADFVASLCEW